MVSGTFSELDASAAAALLAAIISDTRDCHGPLMTGGLSAKVEESVVAEVFDIVAMYEKW